MALLHEADRFFLDLMIKRTPSNRASVVASVVFGTSCALVIGLFAWMASVSTTELTGWSAADNHYNLLVAGFWDGHLSLNKQAPAELGQLPDPYDPVTNARYRLGAGLHDMSYYRGRLYLYFGVSPALLLFWPWVALTGHYLFHKQAVLIFCYEFLKGVAAVVPADKPAREIAGPNRGPKQRHKNRAAPPICAPNSASRDRSHPDKREGTWA